MSGFVYRGRWFDSTRLLTIKDMATLRETIKKVDAIRDKQRSEIEEKWNTSFDMEKFAKYGTKYAQAWARKVMMPRATITMNEAVKEAKE